MAPNDEMASSDNQMVTLNILKRVLGGFTDQIIANINEKFEEFLYSNESDDVDDEYADAIEIFSSNETESDEVDDEHAEIAIETIALQDPFNNQGRSKCKDLLEISDINVPNTAITGPPSYYTQLDYPHRPSLVKKRLLELYSGL